MLKARFPQLHLEFPPKPQKEKHLTNDIYGTMYNTQQIYMTFFYLDFSSYTEANKCYMTFPTVAMVISVLMTIARRIISGQDLSQVNALI